MKKTKNKKRGISFSVPLLFALAANVYADGWTYDPGTSGVSHIGTSTRTAPIANGEQDDQTPSLSMGTVDTAQVQGTAEIKDTAQGVVFDGATNKLTVDSGAALNVESGAGDVVGVVGVDVLENEGSIKVVSTAGNATGVKAGTAAADFSAKNISAESASGTAIAVEIGNRNGNITVDNAKATTGDSNPSAFAFKSDDITGNIAITNSTGKISTKNTVGDVSVSNTTGDFTADDISGKLSLDNLTGNATIASANTVSSTALTGDLNVASNSGAVNIGDVSGTATFGDAQADVTATGTLGALDATLNGGNLSAATVSGATTVNGTGNATIASANTVSSTALTGDLTIGSATGDTNVGTVSGKLSVSNSAGNVTVTGSVGTAELKNVQDVDINSATVTDIDGANNVNIGSTGSLGVQNAASLSVATTGNVVVSDMTGDVSFDNINGTLDAQRIGGEVKVTDTVTGNALVDTAGSVDIANANSDVTAKNIAGDVKIDNVAGAATLEKIGGNVTSATSLGSLDASNVTGSITAKDVAGKIKARGIADISAETAASLDIDGAGNVDVSTVNGTTNVANATGLDIVSANGNVRADAINGDINLGTVDGKVDLSRATGGAVSVGSVNGNFTAEESESSITVDTVSGNMKLTDVSDVAVTGKIDGKLTANGAGDISAETVEGTSNVTDAASLKITTANGDVTANSVAGAVDITDLDGSADIKKAGSLKIGSATGTVDASKISGKAEIGSASAVDINTADSVVADNVTNGLVVKSINGTVESSGTLGSFDATDVGGATTLNDVSGRIRATDVSDLSANSAGSLSINGAGDVQVATVNGIGDVSGAASLDITTANGDITAKTIAGDVKLAKGTNLTVNGAGGNVSADDISGKLKASDIDGGITSSTNLGSLDATTVGGDISVAAVQNELKVDDVKNVSASGTVGSVNAKNAGNLSFADVTNQLEASNTGDIAATGKIGSLDAKSAGDISIEEVGGVASVIDAKSLSITTAGSEVTAKNIAGNVEIANGSDLIVRDAKGVVADNLSGKLDAANIGVNGITSAGSIDSVLASAVNGDISVNTVVGELKVNGAKNVSASGTLGSADIKDAGDIDFQGDVAGEIKARDVSNITAQKAKSLDVNGAKDVSVAEIGIGGANVRYADSLAVSGNVGGNVMAESITGGVSVGGKVGGNVKAADIGGDLSLADVDGQLDATYIGGAVSADTVKGITKVVGADSLTISVAENDVTAKDITNNVAVSKGTNVSVSAVGGNVAADDISGKLSAENVGGSISSATKLGSLDARNIGGGITLNNVDAELKATDVSGDITAVSAGSLNVKNAGTVSLTDVNGTSLAENVDALEISGTAGGDVNAKNVAGKVYVENASANVAVNTAGSVEANNVAGTLSAVDISGGIDSSVSLGALDAKNVGGQIALQDVQGKLKAADTQGISAENAGSLEIKNAKDVEIRNNVGGNAEVSGIGNFSVAGKVGGTTLVDAVDGDVTIGTANGAVTVNSMGVSGSVNIGTANDKVSANGNIVGGLIVGSAGGDVTSTANVGYVSVKGADQTQKVELKNVLGGGDSKIENVSGVIVNGKISAGADRMDIVSISNDVDFRDEVLLDALGIDTVGGDVKFAKKLTAANSVKIDNVKGDTTFAGDVSANSFSMDNAAKGGNVSFTGSLKTAGDTGIANVSDISALNGIEAKNLKIDGADNVVVDRIKADENVNVLNVAGFTADAVEAADEINIKASGNIAVGSLDGDADNTEATLSGTQSSSVITVDTANVYTIISNAAEVAVNKAANYLDLESVGNAEIRSIADGVDYARANDGPFMYADNVGTIEIGADEVGAVYDTGGNPLIKSQSGGSATVDKLILHASAIKSAALTGTVLDIGAASTGDRLRLSFTQNDVEIVGKLNFASDVELVTENNWTFDSVKSAGQHSAVGRTSDVSVNGVLGGTEKSVWNFLKAKSHAAFAFEAADESVVNEFTLVGKYDDVPQSGSFNHTYRDSAGEIQNETAQYSQNLTATDLYATDIYANTVSGTTDNGILDVEYSVSDGKVVHEIKANRFVEKTVAKTANEAEFAKIIDSLKHSGDLDKDSENIRDIKMPYITGEKSLSASLPNAMTYAARQQAALANSIALSTVDYISATRAMLGRPAFAGSKEVAAVSDGSEKDISDVTSVSFRSVNRLGDFAGTDGNSGANSYSAGGLANLEYIVNRDLFFGISAGGAYSRATGDNVSAKVESTNLIVNLYGDYQITDGLDAYIGLTYSYGDNKSEREAAAGKAKVDYESDTFGAFGGLRYTIKPCGLPFSITPLLGVNYSAVLTKSATEKEYTGPDAMSYAGGDYHSIRTLAGFEAAYHCEDILRIAVSAMYAHEFLDNRYNVGYSLDPSMFAVSSGILRGSVIERDYAILGFGINGNVTDSVSVGANYNAEVSVSELNHHIGGYIRFEF